MIPNSIKVLSYSIDALNDRLVPLDKPGIQENEGQVSGCMRNDFGHRDLEYGEVLLAIVSVPVNVICSPLPFSKI
jgi:hypothetical protein